MKLILLVLGGLVVTTSSRRIRVRPVSPVEGLETAPQQVEYYAEQEDDQGPVLVSRQDTYGRATGQSRLQPKLKPEAARTPPVQTIRNYNKLNDDGSFTFGYEAADGSFKEETRGTDCVVRGKYGYIDPDGNKREFTYVSGNPCDPNSLNNNEEEEAPEADSGEENIPRGPIRPLRPLIKTTLPQPRPTTTVFQQDYNQADEEDEPQEVDTPTPRPQLQHQTRPYKQYIPTFAQLEQELRPHVLAAAPRTQQKTLLVTTRPTTSIAITPRPPSPSRTPPVQLPATTYRPQQLIVTPQTTRSALAVTTTASPLNFEQELKNFQLENNVVSTPRPQLPRKQNAAVNQPIYTSELVFDPATGQYNTVVYQQLPQAAGDINLRGRLQPYVSPQSFFQPARQAYLAAPTTPRPAYHPQQQLFRQQQAALVQQSQQLFAAQQQQKKHNHKPQALQQTLLQQAPQRFAPTAKSYAPVNQPIYYVAAPAGDRGGFASGQIDAFLRGHSIAI